MIEIIFNMYFCTNLNCIEYKILILENKNCIVKFTYFDLGKTFKKLTKNYVYRNLLNNRYSMYIPPINEEYWCKELLDSIKLEIKNLPIIKASRMIVDENCQNIVNYLKNLGIKLDIETYYNILYFKK